MVEKPFSASMFSLPTFPGFPPFPLISSSLPSTGLFCTQLVQSVITACPITVKREQRDSGKLNIDLLFLVWGKTIYFDVLNLRKKDIQIQTLNFYIFGIDNFVICAWGCLTVRAGIGINVRTGLLRLLNLFTAYSFMQLLCLLYIHQTITAIVCQGISRQYSRV